MKIISSDEMRRIEKGLDESSLMERAGKEIAQFIETHEKNQPIYILVGKGNNGGDALAAGVELLKKNWSVLAIFPDGVLPSSPGAQKQLTRFSKEGGASISFSDFVEKPITKGLFLDGIFGTGFSGKVVSPYLELINWANETKLPVYSRLLSKLVLATPNCEFPL